MEFIDIIFSKLDNFLSNPQILSWIINNRFFMIMFVIILLRFKYTTYSNLWLSALINIPGTILHETMHFIVGLFLNAHPTSYNIIPKKDGFGNYVLGSVGFRNITFYNAIPSALAPLFLLPMGYYLNVWYFKNFDITIFNYVIYILLQTIIIENAMPSSTDFKVAFSNPLGVVIYGLITFFTIIYCL